MTKTIDTLVEDIYSLFDLSKKNTIKEKDLNELRAKRGLIEEV